MYRGIFCLIVVGGIFGVGRSGGLRFVCLFRFVLGVGRSGGLRAGWLSGLFVMSGFRGMCLIMMLFIFCFFFLFSQVCHVSIHYVC